MVTPWWRAPHAGRRRWAGPVRWGAGV